MDVRVGDPWHDEVPARVKQSRFRSRVDVLEVLAGEDGDGGERAGGRTPRCEAIAAVPGIDALLIGTNDYCLELGIPGEFNDPRVAEAYRKMIAACRQHGQSAGMGGMYTPELLERHIGMGVQLILSGSDFNLLLAAATARAKLVRGFEGKTS